MIAWSAASYDEVQLAEIFRIIDKELPILYQITR